MEISFNVDNENEVVHVHIVPSESTVDEDQKTHLYKVEKICIDVSSTFNCINEESTSATCWDVSEETSYEIPFDYDIPFSEILCSDVKTEMLFLFATEYEYICDAQVESIICGQAKAFNWFYNPYEDHWVLLEGDSFIDVFDSLEDIHEYLLTHGFNNYDEIEGETFTYIGEMYVDASELDKKFVLRIKYDGEGDKWKYNIVHIRIDKYEKIKEIATNVKKIDYHTKGEPIVPWCYLKEIVLDSITLTNTQSCEASCADVNIMLAWYGFNLALNLGDIRKALYYWSFLKGLSNTVKKNKCSCK